MIICSPQLGISPSSSLGGEVYDREVLLQLDLKGAETLIVLPFGKPHPLFKKAKFYFLPTPIVYPPWLFNLFILPYLIYLYSRYHFEILRVHSPYFVGLGAWLFKCIYPKVKIIPSYLHIEQTNWLYKKIDEFIIPTYDIITTISEATKQDLINTYNVSPEKVIVTSCGVDKKYQPKAKNKQLISKFNLQGKTVLLYLGQLIPRKNVPFLLNVLRKLPDSFMLVISGEGPEKENLERLVETLNLSNSVIFTGFVSEKEKVDYYNLADIFLYPSLKEGFGLSIAEAVACGKKVICSDLSVFKEMQTRAIVQLPLIVSKWVAAIRTSRNSKGRGRNIFTWEKVGTNLYKLYEREAKSI